MSVLNTDFDQLATTGTEREALAELRKATASVNGPMERHCLRVRMIAAELGKRRGWELDGEILTIASILHDIGLYPSASQGGVYTEDGAVLAPAMLAWHGWDAQRIEREWFKELSRSVPRHGFAGELAREVGRALRERPLTLPRIFLRR